jgi:hypothetical protein
VSLIGSGVEGLLGFDLRVSPERAAQAWSARRRETFLLLRQVPTPLSVDRAVWPSLVPAGRSTAPCGLETDLGSLAHPARPSEGGVVIAVALLGDPGAPAGDESVWSSRRVATDPPTLASPGWRFMGYDIVDVDATSALANCGYEEAERGPLLSVFGAALDPATHLFRDLGSARRYRAHADVRFPEHAPFGVVAIRARDQAER